MLAVMEDGGSRFQEKIKAASGLLAVEGMTLEVLTLGRCHLKPIGFSLGIEVPAPSKPESPAVCADGIWLSNYLTTG